MVGIWVGTMIDRGSGLDKIFIENATKDNNNLSVVSCSLSVAGRRGGETFGRARGVVGDHRRTRSCRGTSRSNRDACRLVENGADWRRAGRSVTALNA